MGVPACISGRSFRRIFSSQFCPCETKIGLLPMRIASLPDALRHHVHGSIERNPLPFRAMRAAVHHMVNAVRAGDKLKGSGSFGTETTVGDGRPRIALDVDDLIVLHRYQLAATYGAIRAHRGNHAVG